MNFFQLKVISKFILNENLFILKILKNIIIYTGRKGYMCRVKSDKRIAQSTVLSKTRSKLQLLIENYAKLIIKNKRFLKIFIF
jgi:hypothetical protein